MTSSTELTGSGITAVVPKSPFARSWTTTTLVIQAFTELMWPQCRHGQTRLHSSQSGVVTQLPLHFARKSVVVESHALGPAKAGEVPTHTRLIWFVLFAGKVVAEATQL